MLKNEIDVLVMAHNICVAFEFILVCEQDDFILRLRMIEKDACSRARQNRSREET